MTTNEMTFTYQTRIFLSPEQAEILQEYAALLSQVERCLYAQVAKGLSSASCKNAFLKRFNITARQFNACRVSLEGKIATCQASQERAIKALFQQIEKLAKQIKLLEKKPSKSFALHQKKRRYHRLNLRLNALQTDKKNKKVRLCFGGKKLFKAQYFLNQNKLTSHAEWQKQWQAQRNSEFFVLGSKDETSGNQTCTAYLQPNSQLGLRLRLPKSIEAKQGKYLHLPNLHFTYGQTALIAALNEPGGQAISYRFKKDSKSWRVFVSTSLKKAPFLSVETNGMIGIDLNADHIAYVETDRFGNPIASKKIAWVTYGKSKEKLKALTGEVCKQLVEYAKKTKKPLVIEKLDFQKKKLSSQTTKQARLLSSFAYGGFFSFLKSRAYKQGIAVHQVNPAYTSVIGRVKFAKRYGLSIHLAAALCIARRYQKFSEAPRSPKGVIPDGKGSFVAFVLPVRNRTKHVWHFWGQVKKKITTVLAGHYQAILYRSLNPIPILEITCS